ncbi:MAG: hypothetical protein ASARMPREDX12_007133 [Alectoria sarmentosa]|nr:MAG: hypothetical protein ASARMPREDX12_007133 [Alectoria sarmentosa]
MSHALHFSTPLEQKQIMRITFTIPVFAIVSFLAVLLETKAAYLVPLANVYEAWALAAFYLLLCVWNFDDDEEREKILEEKGKLGVYNRSWFFVFQQPVVMTVITVAQEITEAAGVYCATSNKVQFAHVWPKFLDDNLRNHRGAAIPRLDEKLDGAA